MTVRIEATTHLTRMLHMNPPPAKDLTLMDVSVRRMVGRELLNRL